MYFMWKTVTVTKYYGDSKNMNIEIAGKIMSVKFVKALSAFKEVNLRFLSTCIS